MTTALPVTPPITGANAKLPLSSGASAAGLEGEARGGGGSRYGHGRRSHEFLSITFFSCRTTSKKK